MFFAFIDGMAGKPNGFYAGQMHVKEKKVSFRMVVKWTKLPFAFVAVQHHDLRLGHVLPSNQLSPLLKSHASQSCRFDILS